MKPAGDSDQEGKGIGAARDGEEKVAAVGEVREDGGDLTA